MPTSQAGPAPRPRRVGRNGTAAGRVRTTRPIPSEGAAGQPRGRGPSLAGRARGRRGYAGPLQPDTPRAITRRPQSATPIASVGGGAAVGLRPIAKSRSSEGDGAIARAGAHGEDGGQQGRVSSILWNYAAAYRRTGETRQDGSGATTAAPTYGYEAGGNRLGLTVTVDSALTTTVATYIEAARQQRH